MNQWYMSGGFPAKISKLYSASKRTGNTLARRVGDWLAGLMKVTFIIAGLLTFQACSDENSSEQVVETEEEKLEKLKLLYGSWEDLCKMREECEDYPIGYETIFVNNKPFYFPLGADRRGLPNLHNYRRPIKNFAEFIEGSSRIRRIVSLDRKTRDGSDPDSTDRRIYFDHGVGLLSLALYLGLYDESSDKDFKGGFQGVFRIVENGHIYTSLDFIEEYHDDGVIERIANYIPGGAHDYNEHFWFIDFDKYIEDGTPKLGLARFISKKPVVLDLRVYLSCNSVLCHPRFGVLPEDHIGKPLPEVIYGPGGTFFLKKIEYPYYVCETDDLDTCVPKKKLLDTAIPHFKKIDTMYKLITTKPPHNEEYRK